VRVLDLFSGIGGFSLGLERAGFTTVAFCEIEPFCRAVLKKHWPHVPCYEDVRTLTAERLAADGISVDVICGGFPCQDLSTVGKQAGIDADRSGLWSEMVRLAGELRPEYLLVENVTNLLAGERGAWFGRVLGDLASLGYDAEWHCIPASAVGAPHIRDRAWVIAYPDAAEDDCGSECWLLSHNALSGRDRGAAWRGPMPAVSRVDDGIPHRLDRLAALGNAVVPQIPEIIGRAILAAEAA
jgi:DNA (cytosine-5)-methyltransferase 1